MTLEPTAVERFFAPAGPLAMALARYEPRAEQGTLAVAVAKALSESSSLIAEAGTGTGKSLAYLVPALASGLVVVVSTATKALQDQLIESDVPLVERATQRSFAVALLKGRSSYLCLHRFDAFAAAPPLPSTPDRERYDALVAWAQRTENGDRSELATIAEDDPAWRQVTVSSEQCLGRTCPEFDRCYVTRARRAAQEAQLVIVNHHLYFADAALRARAADSAAVLLPAHDAVIFDEAHELEEVATQHFGEQVSDRRVQDLVQDVLVACDPDQLKTVKALTTGVARALEALWRALPFDEHRRRLRTNDISATARALGNELLDLLHALGTTLAGSTAEDARRLAGRCAELGQALDRCLAPSEGASDDADAVQDEPRAQPYVHFTERHGRSRAIAARPLAVAPLVQGALGATPAVFVSATLAVKGALDHASETLGITDAAKLIVGSPFDYATRCRLYVADDLPGPDAADFADRATTRTLELVRASGGGAFVLCTSHRMSQLLALRLRAELPLRVLAQQDGPRARLLDAFRDDGNAVLVGSMSFWSGVDVAGPALRLVVIDRLPFASPADPIAAARADALRRQGRDPFRHDSLPSAVLTLRQGFGRLIRSREDHGVVAILDPRIVTRGYGRTFLNSLPSCPRSATMDEVRAFYAANGRPS